MEQDNSIDIFYVANLEDALRTYAPNHPILVEGATEKPLTEEEKFEARLQKIRDDSKKKRTARDEMVILLTRISNEGDTNG